MITAKKLSLAVQERLLELNETPESLVAQAKAILGSPMALLTKRSMLERDLRDAELVRPAVDQKLPNLDYGTVRAIERAVGYSEFTLFAFSADGCGLPEYGEEYIR